MSTLLRSFSTLTGAMRNPTPSACKKHDTEVSTSDGPGPLLKAAHKARHLHVSLSRCPSISPDVHNRHSHQFTDTVAMNQSQGLHVFVPLNSKLKSALPVCLVVFCLWSCLFGFMFGFSYASPEVKSRHRSCPQPFSAKSTQNRAQGPFSLPVIAAAVTMWLQKYTDKSDFVLNLSFEYTGSYTGGIFK